jgi:2-haloacid dehalogenase
VRDVCVFDVNETLLDLSALDEHFERIFGDAAVRPAWFGVMLQLAFVSTIAGPYARFGDCAMAALEMTAAQRRVELRDTDRRAVAQGMTRLPAHPEVPGALRRLRSAGVRIATLTNSTAEVAEAQLTFAGLRDDFEASFSADEVARLKPAPEPYLMAAERLGIRVGAMRLVAAHAWDVAGAASAGARTAFVARPGKVLDPRYPAPDVVGADLDAVVEQVLSGRVS